MKIESFTTNCLALQDVLNQDLQQRQWLVILNFQSYFTPRKTCIGLSIFNFIKIPVIRFYFSDQRWVWQFFSGHSKCSLSSSSFVTETFQTSPSLLITSMVCFHFSCLARMSAWRAAKVLVKKLFR